MAKTIKVIDLLNKIANREELPEKIKWDFDENIYTYDGGGYLCHSTGYAKEKAFLEGYRTDMVLHTTVEIIEEQQDIDIQEIKEFEIKGGNGEIEYFEYDNHGATESGYSKNFSLDDIECRKVINKLVQAVKQLDRNIKDKE